MADLINLRLEGDRAFVEGSFFDVQKAEALTARAVNEIAQEIEDEAKRQAPKGPDGTLKLHPVDRDEVFGKVVPTAFQFGGGVSAKGEGGRFVKGTFDPRQEEIYRAVITVAEEPKHAKWVHDGTGVYGPTGNPITARNPDGYMVFHKSRWPTAKILVRTHYRFKSVQGQPAQPYLDQAYLIVNSRIVPQRITRLQAEISAIT